jgi:hypothetical protein
MIDRKDYIRDRKDHEDYASDWVCELWQNTLTPEIPEDYERYCSVRELYRRVTQLPISSVTDVSILIIIEFLKRVHEFNNIEDSPLSVVPGLTTSLTTSE